MQCDSSLLAIRQIELTIHRAMSYKQGLFQERRKVEIPGYIVGVKRSFLQYDNKKGFVINQERVAIQKFDKFWANSQC